MKLTEFADYILNDVLADIESITARRMFGGFGIYQHGLIFAIIADGELYFKVDGTNQKLFEDLGSKPFTYSRKNGQTSVMSYWLLPPNVMDDQELLEQWIDRSVAVSLNQSK